jgi:hypothetical protein
VAAPAVADVEPLRVPAAQVLHTGRQLRLRRLDDDLVAFSRQAVAMDLPAVSCDGSREDLDERDVVDVFAHDVGAVDADRRDVEEAVRELRAANPRHAVDVSDAAREKPAVRGIGTLSTQF